MSTTPSSHGLLLAGVAQAEQLQQTLLQQQYFVNKNLQPDPLVDALINCDGEETEINSLEYTVTRRPS